MNKQEIYDLFDGEIARVAIKPIPNTEFHPFGVYGKFCELEHVGDGVWDLYLRNPKSPDSYLSGVRVKSFMRKFAGIGLNLVELDGEAYAQGVLDDSFKKAILTERSWLGIKKSPKLSPEQQEARKKQFMEVKK